MAIFILLYTQKGGGRGRGHVSHFVHRGQAGSFPAQSFRTSWWPFRRRRKGWVKQEEDDGGDEFDSESEDGLGIPLDDSYRANGVAGAGSKRGSKYGRGPTYGYAREGNGGNEEYSNEIALPALPSIKPLPSLDASLAEEGYSLSSVTLQAPGVDHLRPGSRSPARSPAADNRNLNLRASPSPGYGEEEEFKGPLTNAFRRSESPSPSPRDLTPTHSPTPLPPQYTHSSHYPY